MQETQVWSLGRDNPLEKEMATHSSTLAWKIPWTKEPGRLQSMGSQRVGHNLATSLHSLFWILGHSDSTKTLPSRSLLELPWNSGNSNYSGLVGTWGLEKNNRSDRNGATSLRLVQYLSIHRCPTGRIYFLLCCSIEHIPLFCKRIIIYVLIIFPSPHT